MKAREIKELLEKYYAGKSSPEEEMLLADYFTGNEVDPELSEYAAEFRFFDTAKSQRVSPGFEDELLFKLSNEDVKPIRTFHPSVWRTAAAVALILVGFLGRGLVSTDRQEGRDEITELRNEIGEMKQILVLNLLDQNSSHEKMRGISIANDMAEVPRNVTDKLFKILDQDGNVNLKLASLETLVRMVNQEGVVDGLIKSLQGQSTLVQLEIMQIMVLLGEKKAIPELRKLLQQDSLDQNLEQDIKQSIQLINKEI